MPGVEYMTQMTLSLVGGRPMPAKSSCATSPNTRAMSASPASSIATLPMMFLVGVPLISKIGSTERITEMKDPP